MTFVEMGILILVVPLLYLVLTALVGIVVRLKPERKLKDSAINKFFEPFE